MAKKTAIRRLAKRCPVSVELSQAATIDEHHEAEIPVPAPLDFSRTDLVAAKLGVEVETRPNQEEIDNDQAAERAAIEAEGARKAE